MPDLYDIPDDACEILRGSNPLTESQRRAADAMLSEYGMRLVTDATEWVVLRDAHTGAKRTIAPRRERLANRARDIAHLRASLARDLAAQDAELDRDAEPARARYDRAHRIARLNRRLGEPCALVSWRDGFLTEPAWVGSTGELWAYNGPGHRPRRWGLEPETPRQRKIAALSARILHPVARPTSRTGGPDRDAEPSYLPPGDR